MRILADENISRPYIAALVADGHDVAWIAQSVPGATDQDVLARAGSDQRTLLTLDHDFADLVFEVGLDAHYGVILVRRKGLSARAMAPIVARIVGERDDWTEYFAVIEPDRVRVTRIPDPMS